MWLLLAAGVGGLAMAILVAVFADDGENKSGRLARCFMGFLVAIVWIMAIADEVVNVLQVRLCLKYGSSHSGLLDPTRHSALCLVSRTPSLA